MTHDGKKRLRSQEWFDRPENPDMTALYLERYLNYGLTREELQSGKPIIGIAQTGSDLSPCNRHHLILAERLREGIRSAGGIALEFPVHPIQETGKRPTASLDRNLAYMGLVELLYGYPLDGVILTIGCDKTTPALLMAAATVNIPAIAFSVGPMLNGQYKGKLAGSGTIIWEARQMLANGEIDYEEFIEMAASSAPSVGYCNTMGTASTMNSLAETLGMQLPRSGTVPATYRERGQLAYRTGTQIVDMVHKDLKPSEIMTREAFLNAIATNAGIGGSTNAVIHLAAIARHMGVELNLKDWEEFGHKIPLLVNLQPAGEYLSEDFHQAGGVGAVIGELLRNGHIFGDCLTVNGQTVAQNYDQVYSSNQKVIRSFDNPIMENAGFQILNGNLFNSAVLKTSVISDSFRKTYLSDPKNPNCFIGTAQVFEGPEDYHNNIDRPELKLDEKNILVMRGAGAIGYPGAAEVVNMRPPNYLIAKGIKELPCIGDGRQSGTSGSPSILHVSPEAALSKGFAVLKTGDLIKVDLNNGRIDALISDEEIEMRIETLIANGGYKFPKSQTPWQEMHRQNTSQLEDGMVLEFATKYQKITQTEGLPRDSH